MENHKHPQSFRNYERGNYSRTDYKHVERAFAEAGDDELKEQLGACWQRLPEGETTTPKVKRLIQQIHAGIFPGRPSRIRMALQAYQRVAAIVLIPLMLYLLLHFLKGAQPGCQTMATIYSPQGARTAFQLPDGSTGWLNSGSELSYPVDFAAMRQVKLVGEAFFRVKHQSGQKFRVVTSALTVEVLGTQFNVSAYADEKQISVVLEEGSVQILDKNEKPAYRMKPDERLTYEAEYNKSVISQVNAAELTGWKDGLLQFRGETLAEVALKLSRWYNADIEIKDARLRQYSFKATFKDEPLEEILRMIALTTPMKYRIDERKINSNGLYEKKKIIIDKK